MRVSLLVALLLAATVAAQIPSPGPPVSMQASETDITVSADEDTTFTLTVSRSGPASNTPLDALGAGDVEIIVTGTPEDWTLAVDPSGFRLNPGESQAVTVRVSASPSGSDKATITFTAQFTSPDPTGLLMPSGEASVEVSAMREDSITREALEALGPALWAVLALLAITVIAVIALIARGRAPLSLDGPSEELGVKPGQTVNIPVHVSHSAGNEGVTLHAHSGDTAWKVDVPVRHVQLQSGEGADVHVAVTAPKGATAGSRAVVRVVGVADSKPRRSVVLPITVRVD